MDTTPPNAPLRLSDVARSAGVHPSTVSRALRNDPHVSPAERTRLQALAHALGYRPNPFVTAFTASVRCHRSRPRPAAIAILSAWPPGARLFPLMEVYRKGLELRAAEHGFHTEPLNLHELGGVARIAPVLRQRGIHGLVVLPVPVGADLAALECDGLALATIDFSLKAPLLSRVAPDTFQNMRLALDTLTTRNYRRIGFVTHAEEVARIGEHWLGAYLTWQAAQPPDRVVPVHLLPLVPSQAQTAEAAERHNRACQSAFLAWYDESRPDVVVSNLPLPLDWLRAAGRRVPRDVGFTALSVPPGQRNRAGIDQQPLEVASAAVNLVIAQIHRNEYGLPRHPTTTLVRGEWVDGPTVRSPSFAVSRAGKRRKAALHHTSRADP